jgi:iron complex transport system substrate-binding protein
MSRTSTSIRKPRPGTGGRTAWVIGALLALALTAACGQGPADEGDGAAQTRTVRHAMGSAELPVQPERLAVLWRPTLSAVVQLGLRPVASMGEADQPNHGLAPYLPAGYRTQDLAIVASPREINLEQVAAARPDAIIATDAIVESKSTYDKLSQIAPTVILTWTGTESWRAHLTATADALGLRGKADQAARQYQDRAVAVRRNLGDPRRTQVSLVRIQTAEEIRVETPRSFPGQVLADIGFARPGNQTTADPDRDYISLSLERIPDAGGDAIIVMHASDKADAWQAIRTNPLWERLPAAQGNRVFAVNYDNWGASNYYAAHRILDDITKIAPTISQ